MLLAAVQRALVVEHQAQACGHLALARHLQTLALAAVVLLTPLVMLVVVALHPRVLRWCQPGGAAAAGLTWRAACTTSSWQGVANCCMQAMLLL